MVVVGYEDDLHAQAVVDAVVERGRQPVLLDAQRLAQLPFVMAAGRVEIAEEDGALDVAAARRGWFRRLAPEDWREGMDPASHEGVVRSAWVSALLGMAAMAEVRWLTDLEAVYAAEDKLIQQRACRTLGISTPPAALATRRHLIPEELGDELVVKPFAAGNYRDPAGGARVVHATAMRRDDERLELLAGAPFLVQRRVEAQTHLRVATVGERAWVSALPADEFPLDWRQAEAAHSSWTAVRREDVVEQALVLVARLGVGYSTQDWLVDPEGHAHFLDLNPAGQWLFLPDEVSEAVTAAIADWLVEAELVAYEQG